MTFNCSCFNLYFNSRPRKEVDDNAPVRLSTTSLFQLTTSQGGRRKALSASPRLRSGISTHDLARRSTHQVGLEFHKLLYFNSRPRKEVDVGTACGRPVSLFYFNSRPRKEVDRIRRSLPFHGSESALLSQSKCRLFFL